MNYLLFTTTTCPKCPEVKQFVAKYISFPGTVLDNNNPDFMDQAMQYGISQAPSFLVFQDDKEIFRGSDVQEIQKFLEK